MCTSAETSAPFGHVKYYPKFILLLLSIANGKQKAPFICRKQNMKNAGFFFFAANGSKRKMQNTVDCRKQKQSERELGSKRKTDVWFPQPANGKR
jgi:hypothetical protein